MEDFHRTQKILPKSSRRYSSDKASQNSSDALLIFKTVATENSHQQRHKTGSEGPQQPSHILNPNLMYGLDTTRLSTGEKKLSELTFSFVWFYLHLTEGTVGKTVIRSFNFVFIVTS